jgi:large subunit ribosomal protein L19
VTPQPVQWLFGQPLRHRQGGIAKATLTDPRQPDPSQTVTSMTTETVEPAVEPADDSATGEPAVAVQAAPASTGKLCAADLIRAFESEQLKSDLPDIYVGDTVKVGVRIREGNKERVQPYEGVVIAKRHGGLNATITVRRIFQGVGVERVFMLHSPQVASVKVERRGKVRRAKLFYLRDRVGKATRVKQRFDR